MRAPIGIQLYSVREQLAQDYESTIRKIAEMGYVGVEPFARFEGTSPEQAGRLFAELNLEVPAAHVALPVGEDKNKVLDIMHAIGSKRIISGKGPADFAGTGKIKQTCDLFNQAQVVAKENGMIFGIHNHYWEYSPVQGRIAYEWMLEYLDPDIFMEVDTYWVQTGGCDPAAVVKEYGPRAPLLHLKDGPCLWKVPHVALGQGKVDIPAVVRAGAEHTLWLIVELDSCATDMMRAVEQSYQYLTENRLGRGRQ